MRAVRTLTPAEAEAIALRALQFLVRDEERLGRFLALSGLGPENIRAAAAEPGFFLAVLDHVAGDEPLLVALAEELAVAPETIAAARHALAPPEAAG